MLGGASYVGRGFSMWRRRPGLMLLGMVPAFLVLILLLGALVALVLEVGNLTDALTSFADDWSAGVRTLLRGLLAVILLVGAVVLASVFFTGLTLAVGDPFYERIWRETEVMLGGPVPTGDLGFWRSVRDGARLTALGVVTTVGVVVLGFVPVIGTVVGFALGLGISGRLLALELLGRPLEARGMDRDARRALLKGRSRVVVGFGVATQLWFLVPLGAVVVMPAAVVGATMLARDLLDRGTGPAVRSSDFPAEHGTVDP